MRNLAFALLLAAFLLSFATSLHSQAFATAASTPQLVFGGANGSPQFASDSVSVTTGGIIQDLHVAAEIDHSWIGDVHLTLTSPSGASLVLQAGNGGNADNLDVIYADAGVAFGSQAFDFGCHMQAQGGSFGIFSGTGAAGTWTLALSDDYPSSADGTLVSWSLSFFSTPVGALPPPIQDLQCAPTEDGAEISWTNPTTYSGFNVMADGLPIAALPGTETSYTLAGYPAGIPVDVEIEATAVSGGTACGRRCSILPLGPAPAARSDKVVMVIIDGLRYEDGLGHPTRAYVPRMDALAQQGTIIEPFTNDDVTVTSRAIPAINCGSWQAPIAFTDPFCGVNNQYSARPTMHEYHRQQLGRPASDCQYLVGSFCPWRGSYHTSYGPDVWPQWVATAGSDNDIWAAAQTVMTTDAPSLLTVYLADVDHAGHANNWPDYVAAIQNADQIVGDLWDLIQATPEYANRTTMIVSNDHGRHWYDFSGHGDGCSGCRTIQLLAVGPPIKKNHVSNVPRAIPDITPTIGALLGFHTEYADGNVMQEIFNVCQEDLGSGGPGSAQIQCCGGDLSSGTSADVFLSQGPPNRQVYGLVSAILNPVATVGGTLFNPNPSQVFSFVTDAAGALQIRNIPGGGGPMDLYLQFVFVDPIQVPSAPHVGFSNILEVSFLP